MKEERQRKEMEERAELLRQIRALEKVPKAKMPKIVDPSESSGVGYLSEMSLTELRTKLSILKEEEEISLAQKREEIRKFKLREQEELNERAQFVLKFREQAKEEKRQK